MADETYNLKDPAQRHKAKARMSAYQRDRATRGRVSEGMEVQTPEERELEREKQRAMNQTAADDRREELHQARLDAARAKGKKSITTGQLSKDEFARQSGKSKGGKSSTKINVDKLVSKAPRRVLVGELVAAFAFITLNELAGGNTPVIRSYVGAGITYFVLGVATEIGGPEVAKVSVGLGGLVLLAIAMRAAPSTARAVGALGAPSATPTTPTGSGAARVVHSSNTGGSRGNSIGHRGQSPNLNRKG